MYPTNRRLCWILALQLGLAAPATSVFAQSPEVGPDQQVEPAQQAQPAEQANQADIAEPTPEQQDLNTKAVEAMIQDEYASAAALLEQSNMIGELNVAYLNLGRAYQRLGKCAKARAALRKALTAPQVAKPRPKVVQQKAKAYLAELDEQCEQAAPAGAQSAQADDAAPPVEPADESAGAPVWAWSATIGGGVLVLVGGGLHLRARSLRTELFDESNYDAQGVHQSLTEQQARDQADRADALDTVAVGSAIAGGAALAVGIWGIVTTPDEAAPESASMSIGPTRDGWQVQWHTSF